jgi:acetoin utilization protein AcuB
MFVREVMTTNVVTVSSNTSLADARRIMEFHRIRRLPVVDKNKLVGVVSRDALDKAGPSQLTTFSIHELTYLLGKITVKEVMSQKLFTVPPDMTVEEAVALAQEKQVGAVLVVEGDQLLGIATTNDFFYKIVNPILGVGKSGKRIVVRDCKGLADVTGALGVIDKMGVKVSTMFTLPRADGEAQDLTVHLESADASPIIDELNKQGYNVHSRMRLGV